MRLCKMTSVMCLAAIAMAALVTGPARGEEGVRVLMDQVKLVADRLDDANRQLDSLMADALAGGRQVDELRRSWRGGESPERVLRQLDFVENDVRARQRELVGIAGDVQMLGERLEFIGSKAQFLNDPVLNAAISQAKKLFYATEDHVGVVQSEIDSVQQSIESLRYDIERDLGTR